MKMMKNINLILCIIIITGFLTQNALANLPPSAYGHDNGWEGYKTYNKGGVDMTVVFNVYDTVANPTEFTWNGGASFTDRYIYAYQIINNSDSQDISLFTLLDKSNNPLSQQLMHSTCSQWDGSSLSVAPDPGVSAQQGIWEWTASGGFLSAGKNSWYLIFGSDNTPTKGSFKVSTASETEPPIPTPEPCTLALIGIASAMLAAKRGKKRQAG